MKKVWTLPADENWICDQLTKDWVDYNADMSTTNINEADILWLLSDWRWSSIPYGMLASKKVVTTVHHIVPEKFNGHAQFEFELRDKITDVYHVYNQLTLDFIRPLTQKPIELIHYWANQNLWKKSSLSKMQLRDKLGLPRDCFIMGSFQRDTEGHDLRSPKLEKGPDLLARAFEHYRDCVFDEGELFVVLAGWRRQYIIEELKKLGVKHKYFELPPQEVVSELYQCLDLYPVTARHEGGPQSLIETGLLGVPVVSRNVGIASQVLPATAISDWVPAATPAVPNVESMKLPNGFMGYRKLFQSL